MTPHDVSSLIALNTSLAYEISTVITKVDHLCVSPIKPGTRKIPDLEADLQFNFDSKHELVSQQESRSSVLPCGSDRGGHNPLRCILQHGVLVVQESRVAALCRFQDLKVLEA